MGPWAVHVKPFHIDTWPTQLVATHIRDERQSMSLGCPPGSTSASARNVVPSKSQVPPWLSPPRQYVALAQETDTTMVEEVEVPGMPRTADHDVPFQRDQKVPSFARQKVRLTQLTR